MHRTRDSIIASRRKDVLRFWAMNYHPDELLASLKDKYPNMTINTVYDDIAWCKKEGEAYIELRFLPEFGQVFMKVKANLEETSKQAISIFYAGLDWENVLDGQRKKREEEWKKLDVLEEIERRNLEKLELQKQMEQTKDPGEKIALMRRLGYFDQNRMGIPY